MQVGRTTGNSPGQAPSFLIVRLDAVALGAAMGAVSGVVLFLATAALLVKGGEVVGPMLGLLSQFLPGYTVSWPGAAIGLVYGLAIGFALGWLVALLHNALMIGWMLVIKLKASGAVMQDAIDPDHAGS